MSRKIILVLVACAAAGFLLYNLSSKQQGPQEEASLSQTMESKGSDLLSSTKQAAEEMAEQAAAKVEEAQEEMAAVVEDAAVQMEEAKAEVAAVAKDAAAKMEEAKAEVADAADEMVAAVDQVAVEAEQAKAGIDKTAKIKELLAQAQGFVDSGKYQEAINAANFILSNIDSGSIEAKDLLSLAKTKLQGAAEEKVGDIKKDVMGAVSDSKGLLGQ